jgi:preprotein translocase subunit YajC
MTIDQIKIGDLIETAAGGIHEVMNIEDKLIWFKIPNGIGQTIALNIKQIIILKPNEKKAKINKTA